MTPTTSPEQEALDLVSTWVEQVRPGRGYEALVDALLAFALRQRQAADQELALARLALTNANLLIGLAADECAQTVAEAERQTRQAVTQEAVRIVALGCPDMSDISHCHRCHEQLVVALCEGLGGAETPGARRAAHDDS